jgi:ribosomal protein S18 acetylase RimI-like enzyme
MHETFHIRRAQPKDAKALTAFNLSLALETEGKRLKSSLVTQGVEALLSGSAPGFYVVAEQAEKVVASLLITTEWSDWRNGEFWWIQSVYVSPEVRRRGIYRQLYGHVHSMAEQNDRVCGFRLYVEKSNHRAQETYLNLGMQETEYVVFEQLKPGIAYLETGP